MTDSQQDYKFEGWGAFGKDSIKGKMEWFEYEPKKFDEEDIDIKIQYCGICGSDLHTMSSGWGPVDYPQVVGHEIVGEVVRVGSAVKDIKIGDIVGVGAQNDSCRECSPCKADKEPYCDEGQVGTYAGVYKRGAGKGDKSYGGYANYHRCPAHFAIKIPEGLDPAVAAPLMCGGTTLYSPLTQYGAGKTAKDVGIIGIGGLGHFGLLFAKALGANVTAISHSDHKKEDAEKMGATHFIATGDNIKEAFAKHKRSLDLIISTTSERPEVAPGGLFVSPSRWRHSGAMWCARGSRAAAAILQLADDADNVHVTGSAIGSPAVIRNMLQDAVKLDVKPWIQKYSMKDANQAVVNMDNSKAKYRFVLVNETNGGKL